MREQSCILESCCLSPIRTVLEELRVRRLAVIQEEICCRAFCKLGQPHYRQHDMSYRGHRIASNDAERHAVIIIIIFLFFLFFLFYFFKPSVSRIPRDFGKKLIKKEKIVEVILLLLFFALGSKKIIIIIIIR